MAKKKTNMKKAVAPPTKKMKGPKVTNTLVTQLVNRGAMAAGALAARAIGRIVGVGDYTVKSNSLEQTGGTLAGEVPHFGPENNSTRIRHREFVKDITVPATPTAFTNTAFVINPSNKDLFPWLGNIAESWQQYRIHGMVFYFKTTTSDYAANGALGKIAMATNYNVRDAAYANMQELENAEFSVSGKPSVSRMHPLECAANNGLPLVRYVRDSQYDPTGGDDRLYDAGKFQFATQGLAGTASQVLGELWVAYDIEFYKPIVGRTPTAVEYEPVVVPEFNTLGGNNTHSLFQVERTALPIAGLTKQQMWEAIHNPGSFVRAAPVVVDSALIARSPYRPTPDPDPPQFTYPAYWDEAVGAPNKRELRLTRPGIWYMHFRVDIAKNQNSNITSANTEMMTPPVTQLPSAWNSWQDGAIEVQARYANNTPNMDGQIQVLSLGVHTGWTRPTKNDVNSFGTLGNKYGAFLYRNGFDWSLIMWVPEDLVAEGNYVAIRFQTPNETATTIGPAFQWSGNSYFDYANVSNIQFELGVVTVSEKTYYRPVSQGITQDDAARLEESIGTVTKLIPKLRDLGFNV